MAGLFWAQSGAWLHEAVRKGVAVFTQTDGIETLNERHQECKAPKEADTNEAQANDASQLWVCGIGQF